MIIRIDKCFMVELQKKGYDLDYKNLAEIYQTFRKIQGEMVSGNDDEERATESQKKALF